jgi:GAF domain-containing protein
MNNNFSGNSPSSSPRTAGFSLRNLWQRLVEPPATIVGAAQRRQARLISTLLLFLMLAGLSGPISETFYLHNPGIASVLTGSELGFIVAYILSRFKRYQPAVIIMLLAIAAFPSASIILGNDYSALGLLTAFIFGAAVIVLSGTLASFRTTTILSIALVLGILILPILFPAIQFGNIVLPLAFNLAISALVLILTNHRNLVEKDRLAEVDSVNATLKDSNAALDARTHELALAAEVGRGVSQVRALDIMLKDAVELIRTRFDLHYVQVYVANSAQTELRLHTGSGQIGAELVGRGHRLQINAASINGRAAEEKHSVVIADTSASPTFRPNPLLPETRSEMAVPLLLGDRVLGVLDMQSTQAGSLHENMLAGFEALAGQLAVAIQNANLLSESEKARFEVESLARRLTRTNWADYLDAIHKPEKIGYVFEQDQVLPQTDPGPAKDDALVAPIAVVGESLGNLVVELEGPAPIARTNELINSVARQVAQQIENLRLLESTERYRLETEEASRRLISQGWNTYTESMIEKSAYLYDLNEVVHAGTESPVGDKSVTLPIKVRDAAIGQLAVNMDQHDNQSLEFANAIAARLGTHIESLRQADQTQSALAQSTRLFEASSHLTQAATIQDLLRVAVESVDIPEINRAVLGLFNYTAANELENMTIAAGWWNGKGTRPAEALGKVYPVNMFKAFSLFARPTPLFASDVFNDPNADASTLEVARQQNFRAVAILPLFQAGQQVGVLMLQAETPHNFTPDETRLFTALAPQVATVLENRRQFDRAQKQAERETLLNTIGQKIRSATSVEAVLQIAARELGHALGASLTVAQLGLKERE